MIIEINRGEGVTELKEVRNGIKEIVLVLSLVLPVVFGFIFTDRLLETGVGFLIFWGAWEAWLLLFLYANSRDRRTGRHKRSHKR